MSESTSHAPLRPWQQIAQELARETSRKRILELSDELNCAMEQQRAVRNANKTNDTDQAPRECAT